MNALRVLAGGVVLWTCPIGFLCACSNIQFLCACSNIQFRTCIPVYQFLRVGFGWIAHANIYIRILHEIYNLCTRIIHIQDCLYPQRKKINLLKILKVPLSTESEQFPKAFPYYYNLKVIKPQTLILDCFHVIIFFNLILAC